MDDNRKQILFFFPTTKNHQRLISRICSLIENNKSISYRVIDLKKLIKEKYPMRILWFIIRKIGLALLLGLPRDTQWIVPLIIHRKGILSFLKKDISKTNVGCIIILDQYISLIHAVCIILGKMLRVPVVVIPYVCHHINDIITSRKKNKEVLRVSNSFCGHLVSLFTTKWTITRKRRKILWLDPLSIIGIKLLGLSVENPLNGVNKYVFSLFVSSEDARNRLLTCGFSSERIKIVGDVAYDLFYKEKIDQEKRKMVLGLATGANTVIYSIVPDLKKNTLYGDYRKYIDAYSRQLKRLKESGWNVLCNPHPSTGELAIKRFVDAGFIVSREDLAKLLPHADLYITSYSSTLTWCATMGIPAIDHDIYKYGYIGNKHKGIVTIRNILEFEELIQKITTQADEWKTWQKTAKEDRKMYGKVDGHVIDRILKGIEYAKANLHEKDN